MKNEIVLFTDGDINIEVELSPELETVWLTQKQMGEVFEVKAEKMAKKYDCAFVDNEMPYGRVPQGHPVIVDYFYHEEIRGTENTGKRNR